MKYIFSRTFIVIAILNLAFLSSISIAENVGVEGLSTEVRTVLTQEMVVVDLAMKNIISANAEGDLEKIASIAKQIKDSFILKKSLTKHQKHELHSKLPIDFINQDKEFHYMAGMLEHAADMKKSELINFYYSKLFEACSSCHKVHAKHRFPKFSGKTKAVSHEH
jgi:hypothetical protein